MSGLAALLAGHNPPDLYQWHSAAHVPDVQHAVEPARWEFVYLDGWTIEDKESFLKAAAHAFDADDDREALTWLFTPDETIPGSPMDALRENRGTEIKRRAQAMAF